MPLNKRVRKTSPKPDHSDSTGKAEVLEVLGVFTVGSGLEAEWIPEVEACPT